MTNSVARKKKANKTEYKPEYDLEALRERFGNNRQEPEGLSMPEMRMIPIEDLQVDEKYQRKLSTNHVLKMLSDFETSGVGFLYVGRRKDGTFWVVDGQQRLKLVKYLNAIFPDRFKTIPCEVFQSEGKKHEARLYRVRNHKKKMTHLDIFKARYIYREADAIAILKIVNKKGLKIKGIPMIVKSEVENQIQVGCVGALEAGYTMGKKIGQANSILEKTVEAIRDCWGLEIQSYKNFIVEGFALLFSNYPDADKNLIKASMNGKTTNGIKNASDLISGYDRAKNVANYVIREVNKKAKGAKRLDEIK